MRYGRTIEYSVYVDCVRVPLLLSEIQALPHVKGIGLPVYGACRRQATRKDQKSAGQLSVIDLERLHPHFLRFLMHTPICRDIRFPRSSFCGAVLNVRPVVPHLIILTSDGGKAILHFQKVTQHREHQSGKSTHQLRINTTGIISQPLCIPPCCGDLFEMGSSMA